MPLLDLLAPPAIEFRPRSVLLGDVEAAAMVILDYPPRVGPAWAARIAALPEVTASFHLQPADKMTLLSALNRSEQEFVARLSQGGSALLRSRWEQSLRDARELIDKIDKESQNVFRWTAVLWIGAPDPEALGQRLRRVEAACAGARMRARTAIFRQEEALTAAGPWALLPDAVGRAGGREMPAETAAAAYPFVAAGCNHGSGSLWGRDEGGGLVLLDRWQPPEGSGIANANVNILGTSGGGKSYAAKVQILREFALGARVLIIDPEREYRGLCRACGGSWINAAGGEARINPLQVIGPADTDPDGEPDSPAGAGRGALALHLQRRLKTFLSLYLPSLDDLERAVLEDVILQSYRDHGVTWDTDPATVESWPTLADVHRRLAGLKKHERLAVLLKPAAEGSDAALWAGQSSLPPTGDFTVFDIRDLVDAADNVRRSQFFNIVGYAWDLIREGASTGERTLLVIDEAWLLADPQTPQAIGFLRDLSKRIRKHHGSLVVITQNCVDFLAPELARFGQPVLSNASTKLLMRQEAKDLEALRDLLGLSEAECELLSSARRGQALFLAGNQHVQLRVEAAPHEHEIIVG